MVCNVCQSRIPFLEFKEKRFEGEKVEVRQREAINRRFERSTNYAKGILGKE